MKLKSLITAGALLSLATMASAQDKATLDLLVSKGIITADDAAGVAKSAVEVKAKDKAVKKVTLTGRIQTQYMASDTSWDGNSETKNQFYLRRIYLGMGADLGAGWTGSIVANFAGDDIEIDSAVIAKKIDSLSGKLEVGYKKVNFGYEENTSSSKLMTIERSTATRYFSESSKDNGRLGFGSRHTGIFWNGDIDAVDGLSYSASFVGSERGNSSKDSNDFSYWAGVKYDKKFENFSLKAGLNFGYSSEISPYGGDYGSGTMLGLNPYVAVSVAGFDIWGELIYANMDSRDYDVEASPFAVNVAVEYKFDIGEWGKIAPAFRFSYLDTDGAGVGTDVMKEVTSAGTLYDNTTSFYVGVNWYIIGNSVKLSAGYEYAMFNDDIDRAQGDADVSVFRTQLQLLF